jgi:hypothetical protein
MDTSPRDHSQGLLDLDMGKTVYTPQIPTRVCGRARSPRSPGAWYLLNDKMDLDANWRAPFFFKCTRRAKLRSVEIAMGKGRF